MNGPNFLNSIRPILFLFVYLFVAGEVAYCCMQRNRFYSLNDSLINIGSTTIELFTEFAFLPMNYYLYSRLNQVAFFQIGTSWKSFLALYLGIDLGFYLIHRFGHRNAWLWTLHRVHHSSHELNMSVAIRTHALQRVFFVCIYWPLALIGFSAEQIIATHVIGITLGFLTHTRVVKSWGFLEWIFNSPSHHR
ncbi:MAG: sterol desaturase family protein, partial [Deltaproteobacteria bacterium]|nr:sterol desaturase family protein [Deltaproteobacteria bacterium]